MTVEERLAELEERMERNEGRALALWGAISTAIACLDPEVMEVVKTTLKNWSKTQPEGLQKEAITDFI